MSLCLSCRRVNVLNLTRKLGDLPPWWNQVSNKSMPRGMIHLTDARKLPASAAAGCPLCGLILDAVLQSIHSSSTSIQSPTRDNRRAIQDLEGELADQPIYLRPNYDPLKPSFPEAGLEGAWHVRGLKAFVPVDHGVLTGWLRLFAAKGKVLQGVLCRVAEAEMRIRKSRRCQRRCYRASRTACLGLARRFRPDPTLVDGVPCETHCV